METIVNGLKIRYEEAGRGKNLLFLHGWGGKWESWYPVFYPLSNKYHVVALDLPGFGESEQPKATWGIAEYAEFVLNFMKNLKLTDVTIIGHSFGGSVAIKCDAYKIVLVDSSGIRNKVFNPLLLLKHLPFPLKIRKLFRGNDYNSAGTMKNIFLKVVNENLAPELSKIHVPTLIIWGENDCDTPLLHAKIMNRNISGSVLKVFNGCGHFSYLEKPEEFCEEIKEFVR